MKRNIRAARRLPMSIVAAALLIAAVVPGWSYSSYERVVQQAGPNVEPSVITKIACNSTNENNRGFWLYQYTNRTGFRIISPPNWSSPIGGKDVGNDRSAGSILTQACSSYCTRINADIDAATARQISDAAYRRWVANNKDQGAWADYMCHKSVLEFWQRGGGS